MHTRLICTILLILVIPLASCSGFSVANNQGVATANADSVHAEAKRWHDYPAVALPAPIDSTAVVYHRYYALEYCEAYEIPRWVAYQITRSRTDGPYKRSDYNFKVDPMVATGSSCHDDYRNSGFSRGHMAPAADFKWDSTAMRECMYYSNLCPQLAEHNSGIWNRIENQVRIWARTFDTLYVVTGPLITQTPLATIGANRVGVPQYFYKVILDPKRQQGIAFLTPHQRCDDPIRNYAISIDSLEEFTGLDFFAALPDSIEDRIEATLDLDHWKLYR